MKINHLATCLLATIPTCYVHAEGPFTPVESLLVQEEQPLNLESFDDVFQHGNTLFRKGKYDQAATYYEKALALQPTCPNTHFNLGQAYFWSKKYSKALESYKNTLRNDPHHVRAYIQIGKLLIEVKQYKDAITPLKNALKLEPTNSEIRLLLVRVYNNNHEYDKSLKTLEEGLLLNSNDINLQFEKANVYNTINKLEDALAIYVDLDKKVPNNASIIYNIAFTLKKLGHVEEALFYYNKSLELNPNHDDAKFSRGLAYLVLGDFEKGWEGYEWRYKKPEQGSLRSYTQPRWQGEDLTNKTILIHSEQGLGDTFQFIRYAKLLKEKNARVIAAVQKPLVTIMSLCPYIDQVIDVSTKELPNFDVQAPIMSLPYITKTRLDTIPSEIPYLFADEHLVKEWKDILSVDKNIKIGICVQGNENYATPNLRMAVALKSVHANQLGPICQVPGVSVYSLQKTTGTDQFNHLPGDVKIITFDGDFDQSHGRFMDTAAVIKNLDLIITVDTSICHLAAALGVPTWVMLPNPADWRWMMNRADSPWYPQVIRLFKQPTPGDWDSMIAEVAHELEKFIQERHNK